MMSNLSPSHVSDTALDATAPMTVTAAPRRKFSVRGFTSLLLSLAFIAICISGAMLFLTPRGRTANWTDWTMIGLDKHTWGSVHVNNSIIFVLIAALHLVLNWNVLMRYIKRKASTGLHMKKEMGVAAVLAAVCVVGPIMGLPPFSTVMDFNEDIKNYWDKTAQDAPVPHAEELTLAALANTINLTTEEVTSALQQGGYSVDGDNQTVADIARQRGVAPSLVFDAIRERHPDTRGWGRVGGNGHGGGVENGRRGGMRGGSEGHGERGGWGQGRGQGFTSQPPADIREVTFTQLAGTVGLTEDELLGAAMDAGFIPRNVDATLGELSDAYGEEPADIVEALHERFPDTRGWGRVTGQRGGGWH